MKKVRKVHAATFVGILLAGVLPGYAAAAAAQVCVVKSGERAGAIRAMPRSGNCAKHERIGSLSGAEPVNVCVNQGSGAMRLQLRKDRLGDVSACKAGELAQVLQDSGSKDITACVSKKGGAIKVSNGNAACKAKTEDTIQLHGAGSFAEQNKGASFDPARLSPLIDASLTAQLPAALPAAIAAAGITEASVAAAGLPASIAAAAGSATAAHTEAGNAATSATAAHADVVTTNADVGLTHADVVATHADVGLTNADVVATHTDVGLTNADVAATNAAAATVAATVAPAAVTAAIVANAASVQALGAAIGADVTALPALGNDLAGNPGTVTAFGNAIANDAAEVQRLGAAIGADATALPALGNHLAANAATVTAFGTAIAGDAAEVQRLGTALAGDPAITAAIAPQLHVYDNANNDLGVYLPGLGLYDPANGTVLVISDLARGRLKSINVNAPVGYFSDNACNTDAFPLDATDGFVQKIMWDTTARAPMLITPNNIVEGQLYVVDGANTCYEYPGLGVLTRYTRVFVSAAVPAARAGLTVVNLAALRVNLPLVIR